MIFVTIQNTVFVNPDIYHFIFIKDFNSTVLYSKGLLFYSLHGVTSYTGVNLLYILTFMCQIGLCFAVSKKVQYRFPPALKQVFVISFELQVKLFADI